MENNKPNYLTKFFIAICFILFMSGVFFLGRQSVKTSITPVTPVGVLPKTTAIPTPTPVVDSKANWKTYTDANLGITYSFPKDWYITPTDGTNFRIQNYNPEGVAGRGYDPKVDGGKTFIAFLKRSYLSANSLPVLKSSLTENKICYYWGDEAGTTVIANSYIKKVNTIEYLYVKTYCSKNNPSTAHTSVYIINNGKVIELGFGLDESIAQKHFESILSTVKFTETNVVTPSIPQGKVKTIKYLLPQGWLSIRDNSQLFEIGYNPVTQDIQMSTTNIKIKDKLKTGENFSNEASYMIVNYDGGSRHTILSSYFGGKITDQDKFADYGEIEYLINGKNCLFLNGISYSQFPLVWGLCPISTTKALLYTSNDRVNFVKSLSTLKFDLL